MKFVLIALLLTSLGILGCASGGGEEPDATVGPAKDAGNLSDRVTSLVDASRDGTVTPPRDGSVQLDSAVVVPTTDAGVVIPPGSLTCTSTAQCTTAGTCCFSLGGQGFCIPGTEPLPGLCLPNLN